MLGCPVITIIPHSDIKIASYPGDLPPSTPVCVSVSDNIGDIGADGSAGRRAYSTVNTADTGKDLCQTDGPVIENIGYPPYKQT